MASAGRLQRVHGGALPASAADADLDTRREVATASKRAVGKAAAKLVTTGQVIIVDGGTTAIQLVRHLPLDLVATNVTPSPTIAIELARHANVTVIVIGGQLFRHSMVTVGAGAIEAVSPIRSLTSDVPSLSAAGGRRHDVAVDGERTRMDIVGDRALARHASGDSIANARHLRDRGLSASS